MADKRVIVKEPTSLCDSCPECGAPIVGGRSFVYCTAIAVNKCSYAIPWGEYVDQKRIEGQMLRGDFESEPLPASRAFEAVEDYERFRSAAKG